MRLAIASPAGRITGVAFGSSPQLLATGSSDGTAIVWRLSSSAATRIFSRRVVMGTERWLGVALSSDRHLLMATNARFETTVWSLA